MRRAKTEYAAKAAKNKELKKAKKAFKKTKKEKMTKYQSWVNLPLDQWTENRKKHLEMLAEAIVEINNQDEIQA